MSKVNIKRTVENIRANTTGYSPIVEVVINAIQAIEGAGRQDGTIVVRIQRDDQIEMDGGYRASGISRLKTTGLVSRPRTGNLSIPYTPTSKSRKAAKGSGALSA